MEIKERQRTRPSAERDDTVFTVSAFEYVTKDYNYLVIDPVVPGGMPSEVYFGQVAPVDPPFQLPLGFESAIQLNAKVFPVDQPDSAPLAENEIWIWEEACDENLHFAWTINQPVTCLGAHTYPLHTDRQNLTIGFSYHDGLVIIGTLDSVIDPKDSKSDDHPGQRHRD